MYCAECKLRVADDSVTVCPVCQGPLQSATEHEAKTIGDGEVGKGWSESSQVRVGDKFSAYEKSKQELDFNPEELGLQSLDADADADVESDDIMALADLWEDEDIDAELEGVLAEAFSLDQIDQEQDLAMDEDVDADLEGALSEALSLDQSDLNLELGEKLGMGREDSGLDKFETSSSSSSSSSSAAAAADTDTVPVSAPVVTEGSGNKRPFLMFLLLVVIVAGGAAWFYFESVGVRFGDRGVKPVAQVPSLKPDPAIVLKSSPVKKVEEVEPVTIPAQVTADDKPSQLEATLPLRDSVPEKAASINEREAVNSSPESEVEDVAKMAEKAEMTGVSADVSPSDKGEVALKEVEVKPVKEEVVVADTGTLPVALYAVHVGSFKSLQRASNQLLRLQQKGFAAYLIEVDLKGKGAWQRVLIPAGATREDAKVVQEKLAELLPREESLIRKIAK